MPPEVYGMVSLACHYCRSPRWFNKGGKRREQQRKDREKVQRLLSKALRYQSRRNDVQEV